nr:hypothetical protein HAGR004_31050 [Bdellovibrio sp. HAGR004]
MSGSRKVLFLAGLSMLANVAWAKTSATANAKNESHQILSDVKGQGGFVSFNSADGRARSMCLINKTWVPCEGAPSVQAVNGTNGNNGNNVNNGNNGNNVNNGNNGNNVNNGNNGNNVNNGNNGNNGNVVLPI